MDKINAFLNAPCSWIHTYYNPGGHFRYVKNAAVAFNAKPRRNATLISSFLSSFLLWFTPFITCANKSQTVRRVTPLPSLFNPLSRGEGVVMEGWGGGKWFDKIFYTAVALKEQKRMHLGYLRIERKKAFLPCLN